MRSNRARGEADGPIASHWDLFHCCFRGTVLYLFYYTDCLSKKERKLYYIEGILCILLMNKYLQFTPDICIEVTEYSSSNSSSFKLSIWPPTSLLAAQSFKMLQAYLVPSLVFLLGKFVWINSLGRSLLNLEVAILFTCRLLISWIFMKLSIVGSA